MIPALVLTVVVVAGCWAAVAWGPLPGWLAALATGAAALAWAGLWAWRRLRAHRAAAEIEQGLRSQAAAQAESARPDQRAEVEAMAQEFASAVRALKGSRLGRGGRDALAVLPWYMIIGPPGAGKSTALRASGLKFPYVSRRGGVRGVGGTRNCEWWLTNEAVLLDTAGRYTAGDEDHEEWLAFLDLLARARPRKPINGLVVAVSVADVGEGDEEAAAELGHRLRERVDEVMSRLKLVLPIYVLLTKCDLLPGFVETFADVRKADRGQLWGFTLALPEEGGRGEVFRERFDELVAVAEERCLARLAEERHLEARERIFEFPQQLDALRGNLAALVEALCAQNVYQDTPMLRGAYLSSGTQHGRAIDRVMKAMADAFGVRPAVAEEEPVLDVKSYFLRDVFSTVLIPDRHLAFRSARALRRDTVRRWALAAAAAAVALAGVAVSLRAYLANRELVATTGALVQRVEARLAAAGTGPSAVAELEPLRERLDLLVRRGGAPPLGLRFGFYQGQALVAPLRRLHAGAVRRLLLDPVFRADVEELNGFARRLEASDAPPDPAEYARFYPMLELHLLLTAPREQGEPALGPAEQAFVAAQVGARWAVRWNLRDDPAGPRQIEDDARLFTRLLADDPTLALPRYEDLVQRVRRVLTRVPTSTLAIERLAAELADRDYDVSLATLLGGTVPALRAGTVVRGAFTRRAYEEVIRARLDDPSTLAEVWVLAGGGQEGEARAARELERLRSRYFELYVEEWLRFLDSVSVQTAELSPLALLQDLTQGEPPPLARLFRAVGYNTRLAGAGASAAALLGAAAADRARKAGGAAVTAAAGAAERATERGERRTGPSDVERAFAGFAGFGYAPDPLLPAPKDGAAPNSPLPLDRYQQQLAAVRDALEVAADGGDPAALSAATAKARAEVARLVNGGDPRWIPRLRALLLGPIESTEDARLAGEVRRVAERWCAEVFRWYRDHLAGRYPFLQEGRDEAAVSDVAAFFRPSGLLWKFYDEALNRVVQRSGDGFRPVQVGDRPSPLRPELLQFLRRAQAVTSALFPAGAAEPALALSLRVRPTPRIASVLLDVDGQALEYRNGPEEWTRLAWPSPGKAPRALLRARSPGGADETLVREGDWAMFRLLEAGSIRPEAGNRDFVVRFPLRVLGATVTVDVHPARTETPFFGTGGAAAARFLEPFRGLALPAGIGGGVTCGDAVAPERR